MQFDIKGVHYSPSDKTKEFIQEKLSHLQRFSDQIHHLELAIDKTSHGYELSANLHLRWGSKIHMSESGPDLYPLVDVLIDKLQQKVAREKEKITHHH